MSVELLAIFSQSFAASLSCNVLTATASLLSLSLSLLAAVIEMEYSRHVSNPARVNVVFAQSDVSCTWDTPDCEV